MHQVVSHATAPQCGHEREAHAGTSDDESERVAIKLEPCSTRHPQLLYEARVARLLQGGGAPPPHALRAGALCDMYGATVGVHSDHGACTGRASNTAATVYAYVQSSAQEYEHFDTCCNLGRDVPQPGRFLVLVGVSMDADVLSLLS